MRMESSLVSLLLLATIAYSYGKPLWSWSNETSKSHDIRYVLRERFDYSSTKGQFGIGSDDSLSMAPSPSNDGTYVMRVFYKKGTFSGHDSYGHNCSYPRKCHKGAQFYAEPQELLGHTYTTLTLEYEVWFDDTFQWQKGGKLPGLWGGTRTCSGGHISDSCFSTRLMWRSDDDNDDRGDGEVYAYVTHKQEPSWSHFINDNDHLSSHDKYKEIHYTGKGISLGSGSFEFRKNHWNKIREEVHLNSASDQPGYIKLWVDGHAEVQVTNIIMRHSRSFHINGLFFSTFYGGHDKDWKCPDDTYTYYRNFRISTDKHTPSHAQLVG